MTDVYVGSHYVKKLTLEALFDEYDSSVVEKTSTSRNGC